VGIRDHDADGTIGLFTAEAHAPYARPPLSKALWAGKDEGSVWRGTPELGVDIHSGRRIVRLRPLDGLVSQTSSAAVILGASLLGAPVSTTQVVSSSVVGASVGRGRARRVRWQVVRGIALAWLTTLPAAGLLAAAVLPIWRWLA